jgi:hypothetical protein
MKRLGCPFSDKSKEELAVLIESVPKEHPLINPHGNDHCLSFLFKIKHGCLTLGLELPSCHEGELLVQALNAFLSQIRQETDIIQDGHPNPGHKQPEAIDFLEDPQLAGAMREGTKAVHKAAENSVFTK